MCLVVVYDEMFLIELVVAKLSVGREEVLLVLFKHVFRRALRTLFELGDLS